MGTRLPVNLDAVLKEADERAIATRSAVVTDLYTGAVTGAKFINIEMPIFRTDTTFVLSLALRPEYLSQVIQTKSVGPSWVMEVIDKNNRLIARSRDQERFSGSGRRPISSPTRKAPRVRSWARPWTGCRC